MIRKILVSKKEKLINRDGVLIKKEGASIRTKLYWKSGDLQSKDGVLKAEDIEKAEGRMNSHTGKEFLVYNANFFDQIKKIKRGPQTLLPKDLGYLFINSGVGKDSFVVDAGTGTGLVAAFFGRYAKKVVSYDKEPEHTKIAKANLEFLNIHNVELKQGDVYESLPEKEIDILILDLPEPWRVDTSGVKNGGAIIVYLPTITQVMEFCSNSKDYVEKVAELLERDWFVEGRKVRPKSQMHGHTAFLVIVRKL
ncbi:methyltransferase domain-containing protein [Candidatus Woesearchaeota archaeon]|nr:methyltransferase domain-containing protein [Candidatus Woesearchaeota archaeon]